MSEPPRPSGPDFQPPHVPPTYGGQAPQPAPGGDRFALNPPSGEHSFAPAPSSSGDRFAPPHASASQFRDGQPTYSNDVNWAPPAAPDMSRAHYQPSASRPQAVRVTLVARRPIVTLSIIGVCVVVWLLELISPSVQASVFLAPVLGDIEPWRFVTSAFAHAISPVHILFNMMALWSVGQALEPFLGRARYFATYMLSAIGGGVCYVLLATPPSVDNLYGTNWFGGVIGASGAVFGLFGVLVVMQRVLRQPMVSLLVLLGINAAIGFLLPGIAWQAHLGGFLVGMACAGSIYAGLKRVAAGKPDPTWWYLTGIFVALVALTVAKYALI